MAGADLFVHEPVAAAIRRSAARTEDSGHPHRGRFPTQRLEIEITERAVVQRLEEAKATLKSLQNLGVRIALDDFGTGYSGLHHLRELQLDTIKLDQSFVTDMLKDAEDEKLVEAIVSLGRVLGFAPRPRASRRRPFWTS